MERHLVRCPNCSSDNRTTASFCSQCGEALVSEQDVSQESESASEADYSSYDDTTAPFESVGDGRYEIDRFLGEGGKKRVFLARDTRLGRQVALALLKTDGMTDEDRIRLDREARAMALLGDHPNVITVFDIGEERGYPYIVSEYMEGGALDALLDSLNSPMELGSALELATQVTLALSHAHKKGVVHRDLKPGNVWLAADGSAKLGDFGLAVVADQTRITNTGMMVGTVAYMPPECALRGGLAADERSDLYSLGVMFYEMVTGRLPFRGSVPEVISQHVNTDAVAPSRRNPGLPSAVDGLVGKLMAKQPAERPESADEVVELLEGLLGAIKRDGEAASADKLLALSKTTSGRTFVGREDELSQLRSAFEEATAGRGGLVMLVGEPGIGKTRLAEEVARYAEIRGGQVFNGSCYEGEGAPAYWPWVQVIRSYLDLAGGKTAEVEMGIGAADIAQIAPEVGSLLTNLARLPNLDPDQARFRLFDALSGWIRQAGERAPVLIVLDDLHWADKPSLLLLQFLARNLDSARVLVLATYRDVELGRQHPLSATLAELARQKQSRRITLRGISEDEVSRFIEDAAGSPPGDSLVRAVYSQTEGNPFFIREVVDLLVAEGRLTPGAESTRSESTLDSRSRAGAAADDSSTTPTTSSRSGQWSIAIPQGVREVIGRRLNRMSDDANAVLTVASLIGRHFQLELLEKVSGRPTEVLLDALDEAVGARILDEDTSRPGRYWFAHALIRETLYEELSLTRRVRLHRDIGNAIEKAADHQDLSLVAPELAYHFFQAASAGTAAKAIEYSRIAARAATKAVAYEEAVYQLERALQAAEFDEPSDPALRSSLMTELGAALERAGEPESAHEMYARSLELARAAGAGEEFGRAVLGYVGLLGVVGTINDEYIALLDEAVSMIDGTDSPVLARILARLSLESSYADPEDGRRYRARELADTAIETALSSGDDWALGWALYAKQFAIMEPQYLDERLDVATRIRDVGIEHRDNELMWRGRIWRVVCLVEKGEMSAASKEIDVIAETADELQQPFGLWYSAMLRGMRALVEGRLSEADRLATEALSFGQKAAAENAMQFYAAQLAAVRREQGRATELEPIVRANVAQYPLIPAWRSALAFLCVEAGNLDEARDHFEELAARGFDSLPKDSNYLICITLLARVAREIADSRRAASIRDLLEPYKGHAIVIGPGSATYGAADHYIAVASEAMDDIERADREYRDAIELNRAMGALPFLAHSQVDYALMLARSGNLESDGDRPAPSELMSSAIEIMEKCEMTPHVNAAREAADRAGIKF